MFLATIVLSLADEDKIVYQGDVIGVDRGCLKVLEDRQKLDLAIGDFDTVSSKDLKKIKDKAEKFIQLSPIKDESDFELALEYGDQYDEIHIYGGFGGRLDHEMVNLRHLTADHRLVMHNQRNKLFTLLPGSYVLNKDNFKYLSLFAISKSKVTLKGVVYPLEERILNTDEHYTLSNEILDEQAHLIVHNGRLLIIQSND